MFICLTRDRICLVLLKKKKKIKELLLLHRQKYTKYFYLYCFGGSQREGKKTASLTTQGAAISPCMAS